MGAHKDRAHALALEWWNSAGSNAEKAEGYAICDGCSATRINPGEGYLCNPMMMVAFSGGTFVSPDLVCETCFDSQPYEPWDETLAAQSSQEIAKALEGASREVAGKESGPAFLQRAEVRAAYEWLRNPSGDSRLRGLAYVAVFFALMSLLTVWTSTFLLGRLLSSSEIAVFSAEWWLTKGFPLAVIAISLILAAIGFRSNQRIWALFAFIVNLAALLLFVMA
jgi:hypothetical protein